MWNYGKKQVKVNIMYGMKKIIRYYGRIQV